MYFLSTCCLRRAPLFHLMFITHLVHRLHDYTLFIAIEEWITASKQGKLDSEHSSGTQSNEHVLPLVMG